MSETKSVMEIQGPERWSVFHNATRKGIADGQWLRVFNRSLPCHSCKQDWAELTAKNPPPKEPSAQFAWGWDLHNRINTKLGKPIMSLEDAEKKYPVLAPEAPAPPVPPPATQSIELSLPTFYNINDSSTKAFWAFVNSALQRGEKVTAEFKSTSGQIDMNTLAKVGEDKALNPLYGIGPQTKVALTVKMAVNVNVVAATIKDS